MTHRQVAPGIVVGTAGHVDHGKTTLVQALTGVDTDRLAQEKARGMTIELGFAHLDVGALRLGLVDVPGHERFVRAMVAGATGMDLVILVVAADEGVMPQTREHLAICSLLGVEAGLVVVTKVDLVDQDWLDLVLEDLAAFLRGSFLQGARVIPFSAVEPGLRDRAVGQIVEELGDLARGVVARDERGVFRLPVDRVFTMPGFGTVVTGTAQSGAISVGERVEILPGGRMARVRGIQVHGEGMERAAAGRRLALNLQGVERGDLARGDVVVPAGALDPTSMIDAQVELLPSAPRALVDGSKVLVHHGTTRREAVVTTLGSEAVEPGSRGFVQLRLGGPIVGLPGDRFLLRGFEASPTQGATMGGGRILLAHPSRHRGAARRARAAEVAQALTRGGASVLVEEVVRGAWGSGLTPGAIRCQTGLPEDTISKLVSSSAELVSVGKAVLHREVVDGLLARVRERLGAWHDAHPEQDGMEREALLSSVPGLSGTDLGRGLLEWWIGQGLLMGTRGGVALPGHRPRLPDGFDEVLDGLRETFANAGLTPPLAKELAGRWPHLDLALERLVAAGELIRVKAGFFVDPRALATLEARLVEFLEERGSITTQEFKALVGASRKYAIPLAEHFDRRKVTIRVGEVRRLRGRG